MNSTKKYVLVLAIIVTVFGYKSCIPSSSIEGVYVNKNFETSSLPEVSADKDTIWLYDEGEFYSNYLGEGTFKTEWHAKGTELLLFHDHGRAINYLAVSREFWFGKPKLIVNRDMNYHYKKID